MVSFSLFFFNIVIDVLAKVIKQEKRREEKAYTWEGKKSNYSCLMMI
jgi:hypothetical protein